MTDNMGAHAALVLLIADLQVAIDSATASGGDVVLYPSNGKGHNLGALEHAREVLAALLDYVAELRRQDGR